MSPISLVPFAQLPWEARFVQHLPGDSEARNFPRQVRRVCYSETSPTPVAGPRLLAWSASLAAEFGIARPSPPDVASLEILSGNRVAAGMRPYAARYGGHQFGHWAGQLGDGRAITLGEVGLGAAGRQEFQLKGAGPTPYSRTADGRAVLRSSVREFLCSEAMHSLGVPTTRALSLVATGDEVVRDQFYDGNPRAEPGAIVCRVAPTFLRFGNFEVLAANRETELLRLLADDAIATHFPGLAKAGGEGYAELLDEVARRTAHMIVQWMRVGFVHGVMNTDNMSVLGLTIDYGPYGWLEPYDPEWTPNTTDAQGRRYCFGNQPGIALWNLGRFAEALHPLIGDEARLHRSLDVYRQTFTAANEPMLCEKLGLDPAAPDQDGSLVDDLWPLLRAAETDYTVFFRALCDWQADGLKQTEDCGPRFLSLLTRALYAPTALGADLEAAWIGWAERYTARLKREGSRDGPRSLAMKRVNPKYVLRNYLAQNAIVAAEAGEPAGVERLLRVLATPYDELPADEELAALRPDWARDAPGCSALSCSS